MDNAIEWLQDWYFRHCNGEWEHQHGISIESLDNPGWVVRIDLQGTPLEHAEMEPVGIDSDINHEGLQGGQAWLHCRVAEGQFVGAGGPKSLPAICAAFRDWAECELK